MLDKTNQVALDRDLMRLRDERDRLAAELEAADRKSGSTRSPSRSRATGPHRVQSEELDD